MSASPTQDFVQSYSFDGQMQQPLNKENILAKFADGIGLHVYGEEDPVAVVRRFAGMSVKT